MDADDPLPGVQIGDMKTILVIEDEKDLADLVIFNLEKEGFRTLLAMDGNAGLEKARESSPDLILLDLMLPGLSGTEVCKSLKGETKTSGIPVIMVTSKDQETDRIWGMRQGAIDYLVKPVSAEELVQKAQAALDS